MTAIKITPPRVQLTPGQAATFSATDASGTPSRVSWTLSQAIGTLSPVPAAGAQSETITYVAPSNLAAAQTVALIANLGNDSVSASLDLTPEVVIIPGEVELRAGESQRFIANIPGNAAPAVAPTLILSPEVGTINQATGTYTAPEIIEDSAKVTLYAIWNGGKGQSTISLIPFPWRGWSVNVLGVFLLLVFCLVGLLIGLWPPNLPAPEIAKADRLEAEKTLEVTTTALTNAKNAVANQASATNKPSGTTGSTTPRNQGTAAAAVQAPNSGNAATNAQTQTPPTAAALADAVTRAQADKDHASEDLDHKRKIEEEVKDPYIKTLLCPRISREIDLLLLVLLGGALGSFLHIARSYTEFAGNQRLKESWTWWYCLAPFSGAILALVFYAAVRGGFLAINTGVAIKASELNVYAVVSIGALVGMFAKDATNKLGDVIKTAFQSKSAEESKDKLSGDTKPGTPPAGATPGGASSTAGSASTATQAKT